MNSSLPPLEHASEVEASITAGLQATRARMRSACAATQRSAHEVCLLAVSKTQGADAVLAAWRAGQVDFGENYVQEALAKMQAVRAALAAIDESGATQQPVWHLIGPLQRNKTREVAEQFDWVHSLDRAVIAQRLNDQRPDDFPPLSVCLQVNIDDEATKHGVSSDEVMDLAHAVAALPRLRLRGLMVIPAPLELAQVRASFLRTHALWQQLRTSFATIDTLSMGMSGDLEQAIACGSTMVRVGTAIFGARPSKV